MSSTDNDRWNGWIFTLSYMCIYFAAPVLYVGIVQAALCDKLGATRAVANLPASTYSLGQIAPLLFSWLIPHRWERDTVVAANVMTCSLLAAVFLSLVFPVGPDARIAILTVQGLLQGLSGSTSHVFMIQCLSRGTTEQGRARALQRTFTITPILAVAGSLLAQYVLNPGLPFLPYPWDFAFLYGIGAPCMLGVALLSRNYRLKEIPDEPRQPFFAHLSGSIRNYAADATLGRVWIAYLLFYVALGITANLSLYTREALGRDPKDFSGLVMAIRFGLKAVCGVWIGWLAVRHGLRTAVLGTVGLTLAAGLWAWIAPGYAYLLAFGFLGGGELGGIYIPNYVSSLSPLADGPRNLAIITLAAPASSFAPVLHGFLTDAFGFPASFALAIAASGVALCLIWSVRRK